MRSPVMQKSEVLDIEVLSHFIAFSIRIAHFCPQDLPLLYQAIKQDIYDSEERKLSIFVSVLEPDSVCALRILQA